MSDFTTKITQRHQYITRESFIDRFLFHSLNSNNLQSIDEFVCTHSEGN